MKTIAIASQKTGLTVPIHPITETEPAEPEATEALTIPLIIKNLLRKPARGGTPAKDSMKTNIDPAIRGSLLPNPCRSSNLWLRPSVSNNESTRNAPNLNKTKTARWKMIAIRINFVAARDAMPLPIAAKPASI